MSRQVAVVGGGPGGLFAAELLAGAGAAVTVHERMPSVGRKLLLAGRGGLNLTHTEPLDALLGRYGGARPRLEAAVRAFGPDDLRAWADGLGQATFVGSSGRVFPAGLRATPLLRAWLDRLRDLGVAVRTSEPWAGWDRTGALEFADGSRSRPDVTVLALGGASWPRTGSDGGWVPVLRRAGIDVRDLRPANVGFRVDWSTHFRGRFAGTPVKNAVFTTTTATATVRGEAVITASGIEGGAVYALAAGLRDELEATGAATLVLDLRPDRTEDELAARLAHRRTGDSTATALRRAGVAPVAVGLAREASGNRLPRDAGALARLVKAVPVALAGVQPLDRAISSAGGVALDDVDDRFMLRRRPGVFVVGEMLDWEAPTGGYLLQGTFSTAAAAARGASAWSP